MYEAFYGLAEKPFNLTPDPRFLFLSEKHKEAFAHLLYGIKDRSGFVMVSGEIGTGKTTICRSLLNQLDSETELAFIFNPCLSPEELLRKINEDFGIDSRAASVKDLIDELNHYLLERNAEGKNCVLVIDEAQNLEPGVLEQVRLLSNLETETQKLLQIVLIGQPELAEHLQLPELRQLNQRITARYHLKPLGTDETVQYIAYRLRVAGGRKKVHFTRSAIRTVHKLSAGTPRVINAVCDRALLIGYTRETFTITARIVRQAWKETRGEAIRKKRSLLAGFRYFAPNPSLLVTAALILVLAFYVIPLRYQYPRENPPASAIPREAATAQDADAASSQEPSDHVEVAPKDALVVAKASPDTREPSALLETPVAKAEPDASEWFRDLKPETARLIAAAAALRAWNKALISGAPEDDSIESLQACAEANGLEAEALTPTVDEILAMRLPAVALMRTSEKALWLAVIGVEGDKIRVATDVKKTALMSKEEFSAAYADQALIFWNDPNPESPTLKNGMDGPLVRDLQQKLRARNLLTEVSGKFDARTQRAVSKLQAQMGLRIDGIAGRQVRMILSRSAGSAPEIASKPLSTESAVMKDGAVAASKPSPEQKAEPSQPQPAPSFQESIPLPDILLGKPIATPDETGPSFPSNTGTLRTEELAPLRDDVLAPLKAELPKEVTPPAVDNAPLAPSQTKKDAVDGKRTG